MVSTLTWVLAGILLYTIVAMGLRAQGKVPEYIRVQGPITTLHTKRGRAFLDWLARPKRFWRAWGNFGVGIALVVMVGSFLMVLLAGIRSLQQPGAQPIRDPQDVLVIPGVNQFLPLSAAPEIIFGLVVGLIVHEGGHGLLCRVEDIDIESMGLALFAFIPVGAFVEPSEESRNRANRGSQTRMFAAGVTNNFAVTVVAFVLLFGPIIGSITVVSGVPIGDVAAGSSAATSGIERGDVITSINGQAVSDQGEFDAVLANTTDRTVDIGRKNANTVQVNRTLLLTRAVPTILAGRLQKEGIDLSGEKPPQILAVNGTRVYTERDFQTTVENRTVITLETSAGNATLPVGAYIARATEGDPMARAGAPTDRAFVITEFDGQRIPNVETLESVLSESQPDDTVTVTAYLIGDGQAKRTTYNVTLASDQTDAEDKDDVFLGVILRQGTSGFTVDDFGIDVYPAEQFLGLLGGSQGLLGSIIDGSIVRQTVAVIVLPFIGALGGFAYNFAGFIPPVTSFYTVKEGAALGFLGGGLFTLANIMFWTGWINLQLGLFNCIPTFPLDGGHILRTSSEAIVSRLPVGGGWRRRLTNYVIVGISLLMITGLLLMIFGPTLFAG